jgi:hypothetical protein
VNHVLKPLSRKDYFSGLLNDHPAIRQAVPTGRLLMARHGVPIDRSVLADWMGRTGALIAPVVEHMAKRPQV